MPSLFRRLFCNLFPFPGGQTNRPNLPADLAALAPGFHSDSHLLRLGLRREGKAVPLGIAPEDFLKGVEGSFVFVASLWHDPEYDTDDEPLYRLISGQQ